MNFEQEFKSKIVESAAFTGRVFLAGGSVLSGQVAPLPFQAPPTLECRAGVSINARYFQVDPSTIASHERYSDGTIKYQTGDKDGGPASGQMFDITDGKTLIRVTTDTQGKAIRADGVRTEMVNAGGRVEQRDDIVTFKGVSNSQVREKNALAIGVKKSDWNFAQIVRVPCGEFQPLPALVYNQANQTPIPGSTPTPRQINQSSNLDFFYAVNNEGQLIPRGQRSVEIDLTQVRRDATATVAAQTPTPDLAKTVTVLQVEKALQQATQTIQAAETRGVATYQASQRLTPTPTSEASKSGGGFGEFIGDNWWKIIVGGIVIGGIVLFIRSRRRP